MAPRRSAAASSAKRAAEDLTDEADGAKRHKVNGASMAASAVAAPASVAAAASSSNSSSAGAAAAAAASSSCQRSDAALAAAAAAIPLPESLDCPICDESFPAAECKEEGGAGRVPRSLFCSPKPHTYCTKCLEQMVKREVDARGQPRTFVPCSLCRYEHELHPPQPASAAAVAAGAAASDPTDAELVRLIPINASLMDSIHRGRLLEQAVSERDQQLQKLSGSRCTYLDCSQPALSWCDQCEGELCALHDRVLHPAAAAASSSAVHRRIPIGERAAARQAKMATQLAANLRAAVLKAEKTTHDKTAVVSAHLAAEIARVEREVLGPIRARLVKIAAAQLAAKAVSAEIAPLSDTELLKREARINQLVGTAVPPDGLVAALSHDRRSDLERFLQTTGVSLDRTLGLLYRGSRDGFHKDDLLIHCTGHSATLTLVKVKGNGFIFGAYIQCAWPAEGAAADHDGIIADPTGKSFLFSLVNGSGQSARFSLRYKERAIRLSSTGVVFGVTSESWDGHNFVLMWQSPADHPTGNRGCSIRADSAYQPDDAGLVCDDTFLADQYSFAAEEIEVYQLQQL